MKYIPSILTISNFLAGFFAILVASQSYIFYAVVLILIGMLCDCFDGYSARRLNSSSTIGKELDSLADVVTFGVAPMVIHLTVNGLHFWTLVSTVVYLICSIVRLARFNVSQSGLNYFIGLPVPAAALTTLLIVQILPVFLGGIIIIFLGFLMVSQIQVRKLGHSKEDVEIEEV
ncbi:CDP-diacylglycerol--serine O-phosphatidyltransferase [Brochothrix campestris]|uniref:CDP-diacylglycerol--serine O-phosphatidyltransferase n=1 Tax=Brochothrix campestris FSL F6-1037 TaxID=1265861 RepID=W7CS67_9LIST|nr:CDP-diacylglycerol--serine O-phosphatidyltransferase [Brochothrix campestris]EUJ38611.1 CDP-diacylglycerol--serine O-phosphatidyltransferase [Brochothrix campestris FSL F6-1037]